MLKHGRHNKPAIAIALCLASMTLFSVQDAFIKWLASDYWLLQLLFVRSLVIVIVTGFYILLNQGKVGFITRQPIGHLYRTAFNFLAFFTYYMAVTQMPLANATSIGLTAPLFMTLLAGPLLGEPVGWRRIMILMVGFIGVLIVIQPTAQDLNLAGSLYALTGAFFFAMLAIQTRKMGKDENSELMVFYAALAFLIITGGFMLFHWQTLDLPALLSMILLGCITVFAQYTITHAYQYARVHVIAPFEYITVIWAILIGWFMFDEHPSTTMYTGGILIVLAGIGISWYEKIEHKRATTALINSA
jgi:drug/metabolite transporter (DMT)-like permease|tara:strand:- start:1250 stop:2158 length:909 start_codon:yes stop_codon:yes gene_type:complete